MAAPKRSVSAFTRFVLSVNCRLHVGIAPNMPRSTQRALGREGQSGRTAKGPDANRQQPRVTGTPVIDESGACSMGAITWPIWSRQHSQDRSQDCPQPTMDAVRTVLHSRRR
jgi:hypothetical protein